MAKNSSLIKELFGSFIFEIHQGIAVIDPDSGIVEICNQRFAEIVQTDQAPLSERKISEIIPGFSDDNVDAEAYFLLNTHKKVHLKTRHIENEVTGSFMLVILSEELDQEAEKNASLYQAFKTILDNIDEGVLVVDSKNRITYCNQVQLRFDGLKFEDIVGRYSWDVYGFDQDLSTLRKCIEADKPLGTYVHYYISNQGQYVRVTGNNFPVTRKGKTVGAIAIYRNLRKSEDMACKIIELEKKLHENHPDLESALVSREAMKKKYFSFDDILGESDIISESIRWAKNAARSDSPVFLCGETGTGKEMFAQSIHNDSNRSQKPLVSINCAAIPENLLEGIIFGTVKGVFTGATDRKGLFEEADGGTIFLDEINSMPINLQSKLLRALEERTIRRLGGRGEIPVDVRIISSCNIDPNEAIVQHLLRSDLYYRLAVINVDIPPLRARKADIRVLIQFFVRSFNLKFEKNICQISPEIYEIAEAYDWPGNVRQLKHWVESAMNMIPEDEPVLNGKYAPHSFNHFVGTVMKSSEKAREGEVFTQIREQECTKLIDSLKRHSGNISKTANELGISRQVLYYRMRKLGIK